MGERSGGYELDISAFDYLAAASVYVVFLGPFLQGEQNSYLVDDRFICARLWHLYLAIGDNSMDFMCSLQRASIRPHSFFRFEGGLLPSAVPVAKGAEIP
mmetsp:Transcript_17971/g.29228  ORF Transcript_17971/g.29228 Transcript_17971/m.29228 type:complete len:100 (-) Transcript_17971:639-938(-)